MGDPLSELLAGALARQPAAAAELVAILYPIVQARVARVLWRARAGRGDLKSEIDDLSQEVFAFLFEDGARALRAWDPTRGLSLQNFVGLLAERRAISMMRSGRQSHHAEDPTLDASLDRLAEPVQSPEPTALSRELLVRLLDRLRESLSLQGFHLFELIYVEEREVEEVARLTSLSHDAVYAWRSRLRKLVGALAAELRADDTPKPVVASKEARRHER